MVTDMEVRTRTTESVQAAGAIGCIRTAFADPGDLPTPSRDSTHRGAVFVLSRYAAGLQDLDEFDRIWLIYLAPSPAPPRLLVKPEVSHDVHGVFATRTGPRPNRIAMTCVKLLCRRGKRLFVEGVDMLDGSHLLDIRPYVPDFDAFAGSWAGWLEREWVQGDPWPSRSVQRR